MPTKIALRLTDEDYDHYISALKLRYGAHRPSGALLRLAVKEIVEEIEHPESAPAEVSSKDYFAVIKTNVRKVGRTGLQKAWLYDALHWCVEEIERLTADAQA